MTEAEKRLYIGVDPGFDDRVDTLLYSYVAPIEQAMLESDDELHARLRYVTGGGVSAAGPQLDALAERYGLKRRRKILLKLTPGFSREYIGSWKAYK